LRAVNALFSNEVVEELEFSNKREKDLPKIEWLIEYSVEPKGR
jgi:hypothetical protein